jgi:hypothetical protein
LLSACCSSGDSAAFAKRGKAFVSCFSPSRTFSLTSQTLPTINQNAVLAASLADVAGKWKVRSTDEDGGNVLETGLVDPDWPQERDAGNAVAAQHPGSVVVFFRFGSGGGATGGGFSAAGYDFVAMPGFNNTGVCGHQNIDLFAHELGHYFELAHTFPDSGRVNVAEAEIFLSALGDDPAVFDAGGLSDTPPDPFVWTTQCDGTTSLTLNNKVFMLPRMNIMSYYDENVKALSPQQIAAVWQTLYQRIESRGLVVGVP